jgi:zinc protease
MRQTLLAALAVTSIASIGSVARADDPKINFEKYTLPNGLEVILAPDPSVPLVVVNVWYHVGTGNEETGRTGFAHLFEHMMFQGSKNVGTDKHFAILRKLGSDEINGTTNNDRTNYFEVVPANQLETGLWLESDRMSHLLDILDKGELDNQIDVVRNERRLRYDNVPYGKARFALAAAMYPEGHPYRYLTIGRHEDLVAATVEDVKAFFRTWYVPSNATIALVGDFDPAQAKQLVAKWFGSFPASAKPKVSIVPAPVVAANTISVDDPFAKLRQITIAWHSPASFAPGDADLDIAATALTEEGTGRLYKSLVYELQLAQSVRANQVGNTFSGQFSVTVTLRSNADAARVQQIVLDAVSRLTRDPLTGKEIQRVVATQESRAIYELEGLNSRANVLQEYNQFLGDPGKITFDLDRYRNATGEQIRQTCAKYLSPNHAITVITNPSTAGGQ